MKYDPKIVKDIVINKIAPQLSAEDLNNTTLVSKHWASTFGDKVIYINKMLVEYGIKKEEYEPFLTNHESAEYKKFFGRFKYWMDAKKKSGTYDQPRMALREVDSKGDNALLLIIADNNKLFETTFGKSDKKDLELFSVIAIYTHSRKIADYCFDKLQDKYAFLNRVAESGDLAYMKDILARNISIQLNAKNVSVGLGPGILTMRKALKSGNDAMINFLEQTYGLNAKAEKAWAAENGEYKALMYLRKRETEEKQVAQTQAAQEASDRPQTRLTR